MKLRSTNKILLLSAFAILLVLPVSSQAYIPRYYVSGTTKYLNTYDLYSGINYNKLTGGKVEYHYYGYVSMSISLSIKLQSGWKAVIIVDERTMNDHPWQLTSQSGFIDEDITTANINTMDLKITVQFNPDYDGVWDSGTLYLRMNVDTPLPDDHGFYVNQYIYDSNGLLRSWHQETYYVSNIFWGFYWAY